MSGHSIAQIQSDEVFWKLCCHGGQNQQQFRVVRVIRFGLSCSLRSFSRETPILFERLAEWSLNYFLTSYVFGVRILRTAVQWWSSRGRWRSLRTAISPILCVHHQDLVTCSPGILYGLTTSSDDRLHSTISDWYLIFEIFMYPVRGHEL